MNRTTIALLAGLATTAFWGCDRTASATGTSDDTHSSVFVTGRVFTEQNQPLGAVIVHLRHAGLTDTTNGNGVFTLTGAIPVTARGLSAVDTLDYLRDGITIYSALVATWVDTLPDLFLVQRNISGAITPAAISVVTTVATLWKSGNDSIPIPLEWNSISQTYSGFAWFRYTGGLDSFQVQVKALDSIGRLLGNSVKLPFTSQAGNILLPTFAANNDLPGIVLSSPTSLVRGDTARILAKVTIPAESTLVYQWKIGLGPWTIGRTDTLLFVPVNLPGPSMEISFRATRSDGLANQDSLRLPVVGNEPTAQITSTSTFVSSLHTFPIHLANTARPGSHIVRQRIGSPWNVQLSGVDTVLTAPDTSGTIPVVYSVWTDLGDSTSDTLLVLDVPGFGKTVSATADSSFIDLAWKETPMSDGFYFSISDSSLDTAGESFTMQGLGTAKIYPAYGVIGMQISRQSAARKIYVRIVVPSTAEETTLVVNCPPLVVNFGSGFFFSKDPEFGGSRPEIPWATMSPDSGSDQVEFDSVFQSDVDRVDYSLPADTAGRQPRRVAQFLITGWKDAKGFSTSLRGTPGSLWVWLDPSFFGSTTLAAYQALQSQGITLGWETSVDSVGGQKAFSIDSLRWSDGVQRSIPPLDSILTRSLGFSISPGGPNPPADTGTQAGFLVIGNIRFQQ